MKILLVHRYFWPDTPPYAVILKKIAARLANDGHDVDVLSTQPAYKPRAGIAKQKSVETIDDYNIRRLSLLPESRSGSSVKAINMFLFCFRVVLHALKHRNYDVVMISTSPPVLAGLAARISAKLSSAKLLYHCMDIHPEIGKISGDFSNKTLFHFLQQIDSRTCRQAKRVIVLSEDMKKAILDREGNDKCQIDVIQNFSLDDKNDPPIDSSIEFSKPKETFRLIFAGNIGRFQGLDLLLEAFLELSDLDNIELVFLGDGKIKASLEKKVTESGAQNIHFIPHQPMSIANGIIKSADIGIISLSPNIYRYAYPTKMIAYLSVSCPLFVMVEPESSLVSFIRKYQIGINIDPGDKAKLKSVITELNKNREKLVKMRENATLAYKEVYDEVFVLDKWSSLFRMVQNNNTKFK